MSTTPPSQLVSRCYTAVGYASGEEMLAAAKRLDTPLGAMDAHILSVIATIGMQEEMLVADLSALKRATDSYVAELAAGNVVNVQPVGHYAVKVEEARARLNGSIEAYRVLVTARAGVAAAIARPASA
jgi:hypothetical protein